jgi:PAS domain S-box-containing protein
VFQTALSGEITTEQTGLVASTRWRLAPRRIALLALVLALTVAGFLGARLLGERDARRESERQAEVAAVQIRGRVVDAASLAASLGRYVASVGETGVTNEEFASNAANWLGPAGLPAAGWVEEVEAADRTAYEQRTGDPIVTRDQRRRIVLAESRSSYLPATLVSGIPPITVSGLDLGGGPGMAGALLRARTLQEPSATPLATQEDGTRGLFLVSLTQRGGVVEPGFAVVFVSAETLRAAAADTPTVQLATGGAPPADPDGAATVRRTFTEAGQRFDVVVPLESVHGAAAVLPWMILAAGFVLAALTAALGVSAARRARAQEEVDRIFTLSPDLIAVANFDGYFTRVNPAAEQILGYPEEELLARPYLDFVHPDDREKTAAEAAALRHGRMTLSFDNRYVREDGSHRVLEWTSTPAVDDRVVYAVARDVTDRYHAEAELARLAGEQAALRRVATLVAREVPQAEVFSAIAEEIGQLLGTEEIRMLRYENDSAVVVSSWGEADAVLPTGSRHPMRGDSAPSRVLRTGQPARIDDFATASDQFAESARSIGIRSVVAVPIQVEGRLWGAMTAGTTQDEPLPPDTESRLGQFTELMATAIANADNRAELIASRARLVAASDEARRGFERDLHDGVQQRLVALALELHSTQAIAPPEDKELLAQLALVRQGLAGALDDLRELSRGIHPAILSEGGLRPALRALARRSAVPVELNLSVDERLDDHVEVGAYYVISEALTNAAKHAQASKVEVTAHVHDGTLQLRIDDDGVGGADPARGTGLTGLTDRVAALRGTLAIASPPGRGTSLRVELPVVSR